MSKRQIIAVDIDDALAAESDFIVAYSNTHWGTKLTLADYTENWTAMWGVDHAEAERRAALLHRPGVQVSYRLIDGAKPVLEKLAKRYDLVVATSRRESTKYETIDWIEENFAGLFRDFHFAGIWDNGRQGAHLRTKAELCQKFSVDYLIDDQLKHCIAVAECGIKAVLFGDYSWNRTDKPLSPYVTRAVDWAAVERYFNEQG